MIKLIKDAFCRSPVLSLSVWGNNGTKVPVWVRVANCVMDGDREQVIGTRYLY